MTQHAHHDDRGGRPRFLIVQDGGVHDHARSMGFAFLECSASDAEVA